MSQVKEKRSLWRSLAQLSGSESSKKWEEREFQENASELTDEVTRKQFLKVMGASAAFAGVAGCGLRKPKQLIQPYAKMPEDLVHGKANYYATTHVLGQDVTGVLVESHEGRPTKVEGNPLHSASQGSTTVFQQASVLNLYDPDRLKVPSKDGHDVSAEEADAWFAAVSTKFKRNAGRGLFVLTEGSMSPSFYRAYVAFQRAFPKAEFYRYDAINSDTIEDGLRYITGERVAPVYHYEKADVVVAFDSDFLGRETGHLRHTKAFAKRRDPDAAEKMNRLYVFENHYTVTGGKADHRYPIKSSDIQGALWVVADALLAKLRSSAISSEVRSLVEKGAKGYKGVLPSVTVDAIVDDLMKNRRRSVLVAGPKQPESVHGLIYLLNQALGNNGQSVVYHRLPFSRYSINRRSNVRSIKTLAEHLNNGRVDTLLILGGDPALNAPSDLNIGPKIKKAKQAVHVTPQMNTTSSLCEWVFPQSHYLETWGDATAINGESSLIQPLIQPMYASYSSIGFMNRVSGGKLSDYALVRRTWKAAKGSTGFDAAWRKWAHNGIINEPASPLYVGINDFGFTNRLRSSVRKQAQRHEGIEVVFHQDYSVYDGRFINNGWLQELPDPITKITWDNAALVSPKTAKTLGLKSLTGLDTVETVFENPLRVMSLKVGNKNLETVVMVMPGHADDSVSLFLGYGQRVTGRVGVETGFNTYYLRSSKHPWIVPSSSLYKTNKTYELATTQEHGSMEGRPLVAKASQEQYEEHPEFAQDMEEAPPLKSLFKERSYDTGYQWGMSIDLSRCTGCNACVVGCQSENNIPIVGKSEVMNGREMHWIRMDRYFEGPKHDPNPKMVQQPMTCVQCENAPCEQVCPVAATTHSEDGINQMTYNRCIGTRYCANNCPVKVRRFNFFDYQQRNPQAVAKTEKKHFFDYFKEPEKSVQNQFNPDVTVRMRGVMEKCTFCVQRINRVRNDAKLAGTSIKDGDLQSACMQACPADAIVFGDINDPTSKVSQMKKRNRNYAILKGLHLKARTTFLAVITNPHPWIEAEEMKEQDGNHHV